MANGASNTHHSAQLWCGIARGHSVGKWRSGITHNITIWPSATARLPLLLQPSSPNPHPLMNHLTSLSATSHLTIFSIFLGRHDDNIFNISAAATMTIFSMSLSYGANGDLAHRNALALNLLVQPHLQWNVESPHLQLKTKRRKTETTKEEIKKLWELLQFVLCRQLISKLGRYKKLMCRIFPFENVLNFHCKKSQFIFLAQ